MALKNVALSVSAEPTVTTAAPNNQTALAAAVATAITTATTANGVAGAKADVTTELGAITTALNALTANQPTGALVVTLDTSLVTTKTQLKNLMDAAYRYLADSQSLLT